MQNIKIFLLSLLFAFSACSNEVKNTFFAGGGYIHICNTPNAEITFSGQWEKTDDELIPERLDFELILDDGNKLMCSLTKEKRNGFKCLYTKKKFNTKFTQQFMDPNEEYLLKSQYSSGANFSCKSFFLYFNLLLLLFLIFIIF